MKMIAMAAALAASGAQAETADPFCTDIQRLALSAGETVPFQSMAGASLWSLLGSYCAVDDPASPKFLCTRSLAPPGVSRTLLSAKIQACLPGASVTSVGDWRDESLIRHGRLAIRVTEHGAPRAHVGRIVTLYISAEPEN